MKSIYKYLVIALLSTAIVSCGDLDINEDPSFPPDAGPEMLIPSGIAWSASLLGSDVQLVGGMWAQHYAQSNNSNQYTNIDSYNITNANFPRVWLSFYAGALPDLYLARSKAEASSDWGYWIPAQVMIAFDYHILVDLYGTIPFKQAVNDSYAAPLYDEGKDVNAGIIALLDEVIAKEAVALDSKVSLAGRDLVFSGNLESWIQFAKTLKLKVLLRDFDTNKAAIQTLLAEGNFLKNDARMNGFTNKENNSNPLYENDRRKLNTPNNIRASATMVTFLLKNNDPRIAVFYDKSDSETVPYLGMPQGGYTIEQEVLPFASTSKASLAPEDPVYFMSLAEADFLQAECYARLGDKTKAKSFYEAGVKAAFSRWEDSKDWQYSSAMAESLLAEAYKFDDASTESMIKSIIIQKWVASVRCQAWDAFFDINRTGYPQLGAEFTVLDDWRTPNPDYVVGMLTPSLNSVIAKGSLPRRFLIPKNSSDNNPNAPKVIPLVDKMWWHKK